MDPVVFDDFVITRIREHGLELRKQYTPSVDIGWCAQWDARLHKEYDAIRMDVRKDMALGSEHRIDRHKIAAAVALAILRVQPLEIAKGAPAIPREARYANEILAITAGVRITQDFMFYDYKLTGYADDDKTQRAVAQFVWPPATDGQESYLCQFVKELRYTVAKGTCDPYLLAHVFFLLEAYHRNAMNLPPVYAQTSSKVRVMRGPNLGSIG
jgi:hypothetical protein